MAKNKRKHIPAETEAEVFSRSRRRCCICFGLHRNKDIKQGQIAHLDRNPANASFENLAWLCLEHHDQYDSRASQSKSMTIQEVKGYRKELYSEFEHWGGTSHQEHLLNFLSKTIHIEEMLDGAINIASQYYFSPAHLNLLHSVLAEKTFESCDGDLWLPRLSVLADFASFGWLKYTYEELKGVPLPKVNTVRLTTEHFKVCEQLLEALKRKHPETVKYAEDMRKALEKG